MHQKKYTLQHNSDKMLEDKQEAETAVFPIITII